jgi:hypothetical protein
MCSSRHREKNKFSLAKGLAFTAMQEADKGSRGREEEDEGRCNRQKEKEEQGSYVLKS